MERRLACACAAAATALLIAVGPAMPASATIPTPGTTEIVSMNSAGELADGGHVSSQATSATVSDGGRFVTFVSDSSNLDGGGGITQAYVRDMLTGTTTLASADPFGYPGDGPTLGASISADGTHVLLISEASNLVAGFDNHGVRQAYLRDLATGTIEPVSITDSDPSDGSSAPVELRASLSADGRFVAFASGADLQSDVPADGISQIYLFDSVADTTSLVSVNVFGEASDGPNVDPAISPNGRFVAWDSSASDLSAVVLASPSPVQQVYLKDLVRGSRIQLISSINLGVTILAGDGTSEVPSVSDNGDVAFRSEAKNLISRWTPTTGQLYLKKWGASVELMSHHFLDPLRAAHGDFEAPSISADGQTVTFAADSAELMTSGPTSRCIQVYAFDVETKLITLVSWGLGVRAPFGDAPSRAPAISADGDFVAFESDASNIVNILDLGVFTHVYVRNLR